MAEEKRTNWWPSYKWYGQAIVTVGTLVGMLWTGDGINTDEEKLTTVGLIVALATTYLIPNKEST